MSSTLGNLTPPFYSVGLQKGLLLHVTPLSSVFRNAFTLILLGKLQSKRTTYCTITQVFTISGEEESLFCCKPLLQNLFLNAQDASENSLPEITGIKK